MKPYAVYVVEVLDAKEKSLGFTVHDSARSAERYANSIVPPPGGKVVNWEM